MKKMLLVLVSSLGFTLSSFAADPCGSKSIQIGDAQLELIKVTDKPEKTANGQSIKGSDEVLISGIYMFVRNGQTWNVYRCADDVKRDKANNPVVNLNNCVVKNDFEFGNLVKRYGNSGITVRKTDGNRLEIRLNVAGAEDMDYYDVKSTSDGLEVIQNKFQENKQQRYLSHHERVSLGVCSGSKNSKTASGGGSSTGSTSPSKKVKTGN
ncbi:hypothetical protein [Pseudobdellovibrio sp. HCB154]|uniref:hypothetical protein n=1 Tax=Pseudobdellovibrio sp. HCB154 TaxID=3386277 RepID=UPI003916DCDF